MIPLFKPWLAQDAILSRVARVLASNYIAEGEVVQEFERALTDYIGAPVLTTNSGTSALWLAYDIAGITRGSTVIVTPTTCLAGNLPLLHRGARILWADVEPTTGNISIESVRELLESHSHVQAVIAVDYGGVPCHVETLTALAHAHDAWCIVDAAHSLGAWVNGRMAATLPDIACLSFQAIKHVTTGDGGALVLNRQGRRTEARLKRWFGLDRLQGGFRCEQSVTHVGYKFHMNDLAAAIGLANLPGLDDRLAIARANAEFYAETLTDFDDCMERDSRERLPSIPTNVRPAWWFYPVRVPNRDVFAAKMATHGVQVARPHSRNDTQPIFCEFARDLPEVARFDDTHVALPVGWWVDVSAREQVADAVRITLRSL